MLEGFSDGASGWPFLHQIIGEKVELSKILRTLQRKIEDILV